ncbi:MAG TPA: GNAT family N-acetyltransferase [Hyphomicrobiales bacterium]|nr:GNAT family N-acetyltransferase [Hyphomicrobiales bacterium]
MVPSARSADAFDDSTIVTARLVLRRPRPADAERLAVLANDRAIADNTALIPHPYTLADARAFIAMAGGSGAKPVFVACLAAAPDVLIGSAGLDGRGATGGGELGYWVGAPFRGQGFATEMAHALVDLAFAGEAERLSASCRVTNDASRRVLAKCGFQWEGVALVSSVGFGGAFPADRFRLDRGTWQSLRAWGSARSVAGPDPMRLAG